MYYGSRPKQSKKRNVLGILSKMFIVVFVIGAVFGMYLLTTYGISKLNTDNEKDNASAESTTITQPAPTTTTPTTIPSEVEQLIDLLTPKIAIWNLTANRLEYQLNSDTKSSPAALVQLWAAKTALTSESKDAVFTVGPEIKRARATAPTAYLKQGQKLKLHMLVDAMLVSGGEDAAYVIAVNCGRKIGGATLTEEQAIKVFIDEMNKQANALNVTDTKFINFTGEYNESQVTTASDMLTLIKEVINIPQIKSALGKRTVRHVYVSGEDVTWFNSIEILKKDSPFYSEFIKGAYIGYTKGEGYSAVGIITVGNEEQLVVLLGAKTPADAWTDLLTLIGAEPPEVKSQTTNTTDAKTLTVPTTVTQ